MNFNTEAYGGFLVSKNITLGYPVKYTFREESSIQQLNGWYLYSEIDDSDYVGNPDNFVILSADSVYELAPLMLQFFDAPYGTDLSWEYKDGKLLDFVDLTTNQHISIEKILELGQQR
jgi:hypothetical protein